MTVAEKIERKIKRMQDGTTFKYDSLGITPDEYSAAAKAIERLIEKNLIKRVSTGVFYKPKNTAFGELLPGEYELIKPYLFEQNKRIAYITGLSLYNRMGLTTQVPKIIKVASRNKRITIKRGNLIVKPVKSYVDVSSDNYYLLELLDALKDFSIIPDINKEMAVRILLGKIKTLPESDISRIIKYALQYPPRTQALLGALLDKVNPNSDLSKLRQSLNPLTTYRLGINKQLLSTAPNWNIE